MKFKLLSLSLFSVIIIGLFLFLRNKNGDRIDEPQQVLRGQTRSVPVKVYTQVEGIYEINLDDLLPISGQPDNVAPSGIVLTNQGYPYPYWLSQDENKIWFFGQPINLPYTQENVYWISLDDADAAKDINVHGLKNDALQDSSESISNVTTIPVPPQTYAEILYLEENRIYNPLVDQGEGWFWESIPAPIEKIFEFSTTGVAPSAGKIRLRVWGTTDSPGDIDHHLIVKVNGKSLGDEKWGGKGTHLIEAEIPAGLLREGNNQFLIVAPGDSGAAADIVLLDWIEVIYPRTFLAQEDRLQFTSSGGLVKFEGFSGLVDVYDTTIPDQASRIAGQIVPEQGVVTEVGRHYWVIGPKGYLSPSRIEPTLNTPELRDQTTSAEYLAIGPVELLKELGPLISWREQQGLRAQSIPVQAIYDQFNQGLPDPEAIRRFLDYAVKNWAMPPRYVMLVGDASYDPKGYITPREANLLPSFMVYTHFGGQTASDLGFALPGNDPWDPTQRISKEDSLLAVGRLPARTPSQVAGYVQKVISYERRNLDQYTSSGWGGEALAVADGQDPSFKIEAERLLGMLSGSYMTSLVAPAADVTGAHQKVIDQLNAGNAITIYVGHGSINMWGKDKIFSSQDIELIENMNNLPVILNFTCLNGLFTHPKQESLAEIFLWHPGGGGVAVLAPTSLTLPEDQSFLSSALIQAILDNPGGRIGDQLSQARLSASQKMQGSQEVISTFLLFGDPALQLVKPGN